MKQLNLKDIKYIHRLSNKQRSITFTPTAYCNFNCSYCIQGNKKGIEKPSEEYMRSKAINLRSLVDSIDSEYPKLRETLTFTGGEVSIFNMYYILEPMLSSKTKNIHLITNLSGALKNFTELADSLYKYNPNLSLLITASFHEEYFEATQFLTKFRQLQKLLESKPLRTRIRAQLTISDTNIETSQYFVALAKDLDITILPALDRQRTMDRCENAPNENFHSKEAKALFDELAWDNRMTEAYFEVGFKDGSTERLTRGELLAAFPRNTFPSKGCICKERHNSVRLEGSGIKKLTCRSVPNIQDEEEEIRCPYDTCSLCAVYNLEVVNE